MTEDDVISKARKMWEEDFQEESKKVVKMIDEVLDNDKKVQREVEEFLKDTESNKSCDDISP